MLPPPPISTLFPYTTLFRSRRQNAGDDAQQRRLPRSVRTEEADDGSAFDFDRHVIEHTRRLRRDRKSTRLNSSHQIISYAVFCLKKKKYIIINHVQREIETN